MGGDQAEIVAENLSGFFEVGRGDDDGGDGAVDVGDVVGDVVGRGNRQLDDESRGGVLDDVVVRWHDAVDVGFEAERV